MNTLFDSHAHYDHEKFDPDRDSLLAGLPGAGIGGVLNAASSVDTSRAALLLAERFPFVWASAGIHPHDADSLDDAALLAVEEMCRNPKAVAVGEIGLDYHYDFSPRETQRAAFARQLELARTMDMPVIVHSREAAADTLQLMRRYRPRGVVHCFSGSAELAKIYADMGLYVGFTGVVTFEKAKRPLEAARAVPLHLLLIETDCPYMAPVPFRGKRSDSTMLMHVVNALAAARSETPEVIAAATWQNAREVYGIH